MPLRLGDLFRIGDALEYDVFVEIGPGAVWRRAGPRIATLGASPPIKEESLQSIAPRDGTLHDRKYAVLVPQEMIASTPRTAAAAARDGGLDLLEPARSGGTA